MYTIGTTDRPTYIVTAAEGLPAPAVLPDGALAIIIDQSQLWVAKGNTWAFQLPMTFNFTVPNSPTQDAASLVVNSGLGTQATVSRPIVVVGNQLSGMPMSNVEAAIEQLIDLNVSILTELRVLNQLVQGLGMTPLTDELDLLRAGAVDSTESVTR